MWPGATAVDSAELSICIITGSSIGQRCSRLWYPWGPGTWMSLLSAKLYHLVPSKCWICICWMTYSMYLTSSALSNALHLPGTVTALGPYWVSLYQQHVPSWNVCPEIEVFAGSTFCLLGFWARFWMKWENVLKTNTEVDCMVLFCSWGLPQGLK